MAGALKDRYGPEVPARIAARLARADPSFPAAAFLDEVLDEYGALELTPRARKIAAVLDRYLPEGFSEAAALIEASLGPPIDGDELIGVGMAPFDDLPFVFWVAERGHDDWSAAMALQHELTKRCSCESSIRTFIDAEPGRTLAELRRWTRDPSAHVRRLVSEGTRPRLPWAPRLQRFVDDPRPVVELLELLRDDPTTLVRRSVANNLNDIGKDHPDVLVETCRRWLVDASPERAALVRHALRSALKRGDPTALELLGFGRDPTVRISDVTIEPMVASIGDRVRVACVVTNGDRRSASWRVDLQVHFVKANGSTSPKIFSVRTLELGPGASAPLATSVSVSRHTTRTPYPGEHRLELVVNGKPHPLDPFTLVDDGYGRA